MFRYAVLCFVVLASVCGQYSDDEKAEMHKLLHPMAMKCVDDLGIPMEDYESMKKYDDLASIDPCFLACMFKGNALIDDEGMFDKDASFALVSKFVKNDDTLDRMQKVGEECLAVNKEKVSDGAKGCERAQLLAECFMKLKSHLLSS